MKTHKLASAEVGQRLDILVAQWLEINRSQAGRLIRLGWIKVNDQIVKAGYLARASDHLAYLPLANDASLKPLKIVYEDDSLVVVDKPAGLIVHPASRYSTGPSVADFAKQISQDHHQLRPGIVHRLDKDTSGLLIIAKTEDARIKLQRDFRDHKVQKEYQLLVSGHLPRAQAEINLPIAAGRGVRRRVDPSGKAAITRYQIDRRYAGTTLVTAWPQTGRTHQLRVHFAAIGHPVVGDQLYGQSDPVLGRQFLHAHQLAFRSPAGQWVEVTSPLPQELKNYLQTLN